MSWYTPEKYNRPIVDINAELALIQGDMEDREAKIALARFLRSNIGFTVELISGVKLAAYQEIVLKAMLNRNFTMNVYGRGCGKSTGYNTTYVLDKEKGFILLKDLFPNEDFSQGDRWVEMPTRNFWNGEKWQEVSKYLVQPKKKCVTLETNRGYKLTGSTIHLVKALEFKDKKCEVVWKSYADLKVGDYVAISRNSGVDWSSENENENEAYFIGLLLGDGCITPNSSPTSITSMDAEIINFCVENFSAVVRDVRGSKAKHIAIPASVARPLLEKYQLKRSLSYTKEIPQPILSSKKMLRACLSGLFDTDGTTDKARKLVSLCSVSEKMIEQVHSSLLSFGVVSSVYQKKTKSPFGKAFLLQISGKDAETFAKEIGFRLDRKKQILDGHLATTTNSNLDVVPGAKQFCQTVKSKHRLPKILSDEWIHKICRRNGQEHLTYTSLEEYLEFFKKAGFPESEYENLLKIKEEGFFFDKIKSMTPIEEDCLDFNIPVGERYWSNGLISHNTFIASIFCFLQCIFEPDSKILIAGPTFRTARFIFNNLEKIVESPGALLLAQAFGAKSKRGDQFEWQINGGSITAIPLNGEKIRGFRANILVLDEFLLLPEDLIKTVLMPFLVAPQNMKERLEIREIEDRLIREGLMTEENRHVFDNTTKMIALSSASFTFENLYKTYQEWTERIYEKERGDATYFISQLSYEALPVDMIDKTIIEEAQAGGQSNSSFQREYCAQFTDGSDSYFSAKKMHECTIPDGQEPTLRVTAIPGRKYIISIDPSFSNSPSSDYFAMAVFEVSDDMTESTLVHNYAVPGADLREHIVYMSYLMDTFAPEMIIIDNAGFQFIDSCNESDLFMNKQLSFFDFDSDAEGVDYELMIKQARNQYNKSKGMICFKQNFTSEYIRKANEFLQACIDYKRIWFASRISPNADAYDRVVAAAGKIPLKAGETAIDAIDTQDDLINQVKKQCALIEVKATVKGNQSFDLPQHLKRNHSPNRARKDNYTALMLGCWAVKCYKDIKSAPVEEKNDTFIPFFV